MADDDLMWCVVEEEYVEVEGDGVHKGTKHRINGESIEPPPIDLPDSIIAG